MIYYVATERFSSTILGFLKGNPAVRRAVSSLTYEEIFFERAGPVGHYIFTDFDRLSRYEMECVASFASAISRSAPEAHILNHPLRVLERFPLLVALHEEGINDFAAIRIETGQRPERYPVFIRAEDGYGGPETDILRTDAEYDAALADLDARGLPKRGRIAVGYAAEESDDGFYRKYGAFNVAGRILPHHLQRNRGWVVKRDIVERDWTVPRDRVDRLAETAIAEEVAYVRDNPHKEVLAKAFSIAGIDFGRADYGVTNGRVQVYEINTNPSLPAGSKSDARDAVRQYTRPRLVEAMCAIDTPIGARGRISFSEQRPRSHDVRLPRRRIVASLLRRTTDRLKVRTGSTRSGGSNGR